MSIEVILPDRASEEVLRDRIEMPLFFIVGGADDAYLSQIVGSDINTLVRSKSVDPVPAAGPYVVYASRALLPTTGFARTFSLSELLDDQWPILLDITQPTQENLAMRSPTNVERTWIIRALRRAQLGNLADEIKRRMLRRLYPQSLSTSVQLTVNSLGRLYPQLSSEQRRYPLVVMIDDLPVQLPKSLGDALAEITVTGCLTLPGVDHSFLLKALRTSLALLKI